VWCFLVLPCYVTACPRKAIWLVHFTQFHITNKRKEKKNGACFISYESHLRMEKAKPLFSRISLLLVWLLDS
jgi:hypothetical protein